MPRTLLFLSFAISTFHCYFRYICQKFSNRPLIMKKLLSFYVNPFQAMDKHSVVSNSAEILHFLETLPAHLCRLFAKYLPLQISMPITITLFTIVMNNIIPYIYEHYAHRGLGINFQGTSN